MDIKKAVYFIDVLIESTKHHVLTWERYSGSIDSAGTECDSTRSFKTVGTGFTVFLCCQKDQTELPILEISYDARIPHVQLYFDSDEFHVPLIRLYNLVYSFIPTLEDEIDKFIHDFEGYIAEEKDQSHPRGV